MLCDVDGKVSLPPTCTMSLPALLSSISHEVKDADEGRSCLVTLAHFFSKFPVETFFLFSQPIPSQNLGFVDAKAQQLHVDVGSISYVVRQSPALLNSDRDEGTTGAGKWLSRMGFLPVCAAKR